jgi:NAD+ diphosphatase
MIHDIEPRIFNNKYDPKKPGLYDLFLAYDGDSVLVREDKEKLWYPSFDDFMSFDPSLMERAKYLFSIDDINYFLIEDKGLDGNLGWVYANTGRFRTEPKYWRSFAGAIGWQLNRWYDNHRFCSKCGSNLEPSDRERMLHCNNCGFSVYPTISPCVIVAVYNGSKLLLTKYAGRAYTRYALIAGFVEIGESLEQTVHREVMEEVGLKVKNLSFYKSQPWPFTDTLLAGFYAELDGDDTIILDENELETAVWMEREDIPPNELRISLTGEMMDNFRLNKI